MTTPHEPPRSDSGDRPSRRKLIKAAGLTALFASAGALPASAEAPSAAPTAAGPAAAPASSAKDLIRRTIPGTDETVPVLGMGTFLTFDKLPGRPRGHLREVMKRFWDGGGRVIDTSPLYGFSEISVGDFAADLGITDRLFLTNKTWAAGEYYNDDGIALRQYAQSRKRLWRDKLDVLQVHSLTNVGMIVPMLLDWKREGQVRFVGISHHVPLFFPAVEHWIRTSDIDFVQIRYSIFMRQAEERILPAAADRGIAVLVNMPLEKGRLHKIVEGRPLPAMAREIGCANWAQFFLKWAISHPAVTCVIPATSDPAHMTENLGAMRGELPDQKTRDAMVAHMTGIPGFDRIAQMPWYNGRKFDGAVQLRPGQAIG